MREYGSGHFEIRRRTLKSGKVKEFGYGYVLSEYPNANGNHRHYATGKTKREAESKAKKKAAMHDNECKARLDPQSAIPTLNEFVDEWLSTKTLTAASSKKYRNHRAHLCDFIIEENGTSLGNVRVDKIAYLTLERCYLAFSGSHKGKSPANFRDIISEIFERLTNRGHIQKNIAKNLPSAKRNFKSRRLPFRRADVGKLLPSLRDHRLQAVLILGSHGLRIGEILGSTFEAVEGNRLEVARQYAPVRNPDGDQPATIHALCELKHKGHIRDIHLSDAEMEVILNSCEAAKLCRVYDDVERKWVNRTFLVPNAKGTGWAYNAFRLLWKRACTEVGIQINPHDLRRAFTSISHANQTLSQAAIAEALGHRDMSTTINYIFAEDEEVQAVHSAASDWISGMIQPERHGGVQATSNQDVHEPPVSERSNFAKR